MTEFELDMAFEPAEVAAGLERLFRKLGLAWSCTRSSETHYQFHLTLPEGDRAQLVVRPLPVERLTYVALFPRTLLEGRTDVADLSSLRREILLTFLRVTG